MLLCKRVQPNKIDQFSFDFHLSLGFFLYAFSSSLPSKSLAHSKHFKCIHNRNFPFTLYSVHYSVKMSIIHLCQPNKMITDHNTDEYETVFCMQNKCNIVIKYAMNGMAKTISVIFIHQSWKNSMKSDSIFFSSKIFKIGMESMPWTVVFFIRNFYVINKWLNACKWT